MFLLIKKLLDLFEILIWDSRLGPQDFKTKLWSRSAENEAILDFNETPVMLVTNDWRCVRRNGYLLLVALYQWHRVTYNRLLLFQIINHRHRIVVIEKSI
jgi:hypothetical protein